MKSLQKIIIATLLILITSCVGRFDTYQIVNTNPNYDNLKADEKIVFHEINFIEIAEIKNQQDTFTIIGQPISDKEDFWLNYSIINNKNKVIKKITLSFRKNQIYPQEILNKLDNSTKQNLTSNSLGSDSNDKKIAYIIIKNNEKIRLDSISFNNNILNRHIDSIQSFKSKKEIFLSQKCLDKICFLGSYLIKADFSAKNSTPNLEIIPIKTFASIFKIAQKIFNPPANIDLKNFIS